MMLPEQLGERIRLAHAAVQATADGVGARILHVKGYAVMDGLYRAHRRSTDADVLVHPRDLAALLRELQQLEWEIVAHFESGSVFGHAMTLRHARWGAIDVHRHFPGIGEDPERVFEQLWERRFTHPIAHFPCQVPSLEDQVLVILLHSSRDGQRGRTDLEYLRRILSARDIEALHARAEELDGGLALASAIGDIERFRGDPRYDLWKVVTQGGSRLEEWRARFKATSGPREKLRLGVSLLQVNRDHLAMRLGHAPSPAEVRREHLNRAQKATGELWMILREAARRAGSRFGRGTR